MRLPIAALAAALLGTALATQATLTGCASAPPPVHRADVVLEPRWEDVFDVTPECLVVAHPAALRADAVYGPLLRRVIDLVRERSPVAAATRALDTIEQAEEAIVGFRPAADGAPAEFVFVLRGVRADVDPAAVVDGEGHPVWTAGPPGSVRELTPAPAPGTARTEAALDASLFELPGRTWVIATGDARGRARDAFNHPLGRAPMRFDDDALVTARIDGRSLVSHRRALQPLGALAAVGTRLRSVTFALVSAPPETPGAPPPRPGGPGTNGDAGDAGGDARGDVHDVHRDVRATWAYADDDAAATASVTLEEVIGAIGRTKKPEGWDWLGSARVERPGKSVVVTAALPAHLVGALLRAGVVPVDHLLGEGAPAR